jgi:uncharacterized protein DUF2252
MEFEQATSEYERWLGEKLTLLPRDLEQKHERMREDLFSFFRATFYRWVQLWDELQEGLADAPEVLAVGDLHIENFGTWRDVEGRLVWGVNDFDETAPLPCTLDLVRLAASASLAIDAAALKLGARAATEAILEGYREALEKGGRPFVLAEHHRALHSMATHRLHDPSQFWEKLQSSEALGGAPPPVPHALLLEALPARAGPPKFHRRIAGLGSLGRERFVAIADLAGGLVAREVKRLAPSAVAWARSREKEELVRCQRLLDGTWRSRDPMVAVKQGWLVRRLAPDCSRIPLVALPDGRDEIALLHAMGRETANVHLESVEPSAILADLRKRGDRWLDHAAKKMAEAVHDDWKAWRTTKGR